MQPDALPPPPLPPPERPRPVTKVRLRFRKGEALRLLSHHDLMRAFERLLRRAELPVRQTQGFHPKPRLVFALSLPLGVVGCEEVAEIELTEPLSLDELRERLTRHIPPGLDILSLRFIEPRLTAQVRTLTYRLRVPPERLSGLAEKVAAVLAAPELVVERTRPEPRRVDLRPFLKALRVAAPLTPPAPSPTRGEGAPDHRRADAAPLASPIASPSPLGAIGERGGEGAIEMDLVLLPAGTARPDEVLGLLGLSDLLHEGGVLERCRLELHDEPPATQPEGAA